MLPSEKDFVIGGITPDIKLEETLEIPKPKRIYCPVCTSSNTTDLTFKILASDIMNCEDCGVVFKNIQKK